MHDDVYNHQPDTSDKPHQGWLGMTALGCSGTLNVAPQSRFFHQSSLSSIIQSSGFLCIKAILEQPLARIWAIHARRASNGSQTSEELYLGPDNGRQQKHC